MNLNRIIICAAMVSVLVLVIAGSAIAQNQPKKVYTVYVIADLHSTLTPKFHLPIYGVEGRDLFFVHELRPDNRNGGPIGLAVDPVHNKLFVTYEDSKKVDIFDARTAENLGQVTLDGTSDLAGIDVLPLRKEFYVIDRGHPTVYVFDTDTYAPVNTWFFGGAESAYGIDAVENVDGEDVIFVAEGTNVVRWYSADNHLLQGSAEFTGNAIAVAVDNSGPAPVIYTVAISLDHEDDFPHGHNYLQKYDVATGIETRGSLPANGVGLAVNEYEQVVYITTGFHSNKTKAGDPSLLVYDMGTLTQKKSFALDFCGGSFCEPTDVHASGIAFGSTLEKQLTSHDGTIFKNDEVVFTVTFTNESEVDIGRVALEDTYNTAHFSFSHSVPDANDAADDGKISWNDLVTTFGNNLAPGDSFTVELHFAAKEVICDGTLLDSNVAETDNVWTVSGKMLPSEQAKAGYTIDCSQPPPDDDDDEFGTGDDDDVNDDGGEDDLWPTGKVSGGNADECCGC